MYGCVLTFKNNILYSIYYLFYWIKNMAYKRLSHLPCGHCKKICPREKGYRINFCSFECRLNFYVHKTDSCWLWKGAIAQDGYGKVMVKCKTKRAHRVFYEYFKKPIMDKMLILHSCDIKLCVNPDHLREGTVQDNSNDAIKSNLIMYGENHPQSKLKDLDIIEIRKLREMGLSQQKIADKFNVSQVLIGLIVNRKNWKHV